MSKQFESIMRGLQDIADYTNGDTSKARVRTTTIPDIEPVTEYSKEQIKEIRQKNQFTQKSFAELFGVSPKAIEAWESGKRKPTGTAKRLFQLIEKDPTVINAIMR